MKRLFGLALLLVIAGVMGCGNNATAEKKKPAAGKGADGKTEEVAKTSDSKHDAWWCAEHGIPEEECSMCSSKVAAECKKKGDWCEKHDRAKSQCFICDPKLKETFAAKYRAKYGKEPPPIEDDGKKEESKEPKKG